MLGQIVFDDLVGRGKSRQTAQQWNCWADRFEQVCGYKERYDRQDVIKFLAWEREQGFRQNSINIHLRPVKLLAQIQGWDFPRLSMPKVKEEDITRTIFSREEVISLITTGRRVLQPKELSCLALSTVYGLRREEMARPEPPELKEGQVIIHTVKGGPTTTHLIPQEIVPYLEDYPAYGPDHLSHIFLQIMKKTGLEVSPRYGWHSIRRALATELLIAEASALNIVRFMRWSEASISKEFGMLSVYAQKHQAHIDNQIFEVHPFLPYWAAEARREREKSRRRRVITEAIRLLEGGELEDDEEGIHLLERLTTLVKREK